MSATVEHEKRKREILEKALEVFSKEGYDHTTFQKIADRCGISRTILYIYFKDKRDIFRYAIKLITETLETEMVRVELDPSKPVIERILAVFGSVVDTLADQRTFLAVILEYLMHLRVSGTAPEEKILRRTIRVRHHFTLLVNEGRASGELRSGFSGAALNSLLYGLIEAAAFRVSAYKSARIAEVDELKSAARLALEGIKKN
jgi:AcrR family transcriptional regulator